MPGVDGAITGEPEIHAIHIGDRQSNLRHAAQTFHRDVICYFALPGYG